METKKRIELLAPAGDLERLKYAIMYGADAVFIGGLKFSLRSMASNFTLDQIKEGCQFAHQHNAKVHVTCNIVMHNDDLTGLKEYLLALEESGVDAIIASSPTIIKAVKSYTHMEVHVSTQQSVSNSLGVKFFSSLGADRVVLAREADMANIKDIVKHSDVEIEAFIHGGMCAGVSGRCMLSNVLTNRDANRGGCAQSCRWNYNLYSGDKKVSPDQNSFTMSSCDLNAIEFIPQLIEAGVSSLKIEGRMKSVFYISNVVRAYRKAIDEYYETGKTINIASIKEEMAKGENREVSTGFYKGQVTVNEEIYNEVAMKPTQVFVGIVKDYNSETGKLTLEVRNAFDGNTSLEVIAPRKERITFKIGDLYSLDEQKIPGARNPGTLIYTYTSKGLDYLKGDYLLVNKIK